MLVIQLTQRFTE